MDLTPAPKRTGQHKDIDLKLGQRKELAALLQRYLPNTQVWAFGSRVTFQSQHRRASDLDLVVFSSKAQSDAVENLREALEESDLPFSVDVLVWDRVPEHFHANIERAYFVLQEQRTS